MDYTLFEKENFRFYSKAFVYETYKKIVDNVKLYDKMTTKNMINECLQKYNESDDYILNIFSEDEIELLLNKNISKKQYFPFFRLLHKYFLITNYPIRNRGYHIPIETKEIINKACNYYLNNKDMINKNKYYDYFIVGLFRTYGLLSLDELDFLFKK